MAEQVEVTQLRSGDVFITDPYPEKYRVIEPDYKDGISGVTAEEIKTGNQTFFGGKPPYGPIIIRLERG